MHFGLVSNFVSVTCIITNLCFTDTDVCKICMEDENKIECAFVECGHMLACRSCASKLKSCPVCRSEIQQVLKLYKP